MVWKFFHLINFYKTNNRQFTKLLLPINKCIASSLAAHWKSLQARLCKSGLWAANFGRANATAGNFDEVAKVIAGVPGIRRNSAAVSSLSSSSPGCWFQRRIDDRKKKKKMGNFCDDIWGAISRCVVICCACKHKLRNGLFDRKKTFKWITIKAF